MTVEERYGERYKSGDTPWDVGQPDFNLIEVVTKEPIPSCKVLDIGCGTGDNSIWLAQNRFQVIGTDTSGVALEKAKEKASKVNVVEPYFELLSLTSSHFGSNRPNLPRAWRCLMRRRHIA